MAKILIIEDDAGVAEMERLVLAGRGHSVTIAGDGPTGVLEAQRTCPDLIVLDVALPYFDANAVLFGIGLNPQLANVKVLAVTGNRHKLVDKSLKRITQVLDKPFELQVFVHAVEQLLPGRDRTN